MSEIKAKLLTRKDIIEMWKQSPKEYINYFCCPDCRDLLYHYSFGGGGKKNRYYCHNEQCANFDKPIKNER